MILKNCNIDHFLCLIQQKELVCFGAGKVLENFCTELKNYHMENKIAYIIDNDPKKWDTYKVINKVEIKIISLSKAIEDLSKNIILLITSDDCIAIYNQLNAINQLNKIECYYSRFVMSESLSQEFVKRKLPEDFRIYRESKIPKIIHYCWFGNNPIPNHHKKYIEGWRELCPDYEIIKWNEKNYDVEKNLYMKQAYEAKAWGFVPDYVRKDVIYNYGGIYLDTDVELIKNLDDLLYQDGFCGFQGDKVAFGLGFGARKGLPVIKLLRDQYNQLTFEFRPRKEMKIGPDYETEILAELGLKRNGEYQIIEGLTVYPAEVLSGTSLYNDQYLKTDRTYSVHHYAGSWIDDEYRQKQAEMKQLYETAINNS